MALDTYTNLKTAIEEWLDNDDLTDRVDDFIDLAEARHRREVRTREMIVRQPIGVVNRYVDLPNGFLEGINFRLLEDPVVHLTHINQADMDRVRSETDGTPRQFTLHSQIELDRQPDKAYTGEMIYYKQMSPLSASVACNALLERAPDCYLYAALAATAPFLMNDERIQVWEGLYRQSRDGVNKLDQKTVGVPVASVPGIMP